MESTSETLLVRLREPGDKAAWERFVKLYTPFLFRWALRAGLQDQDAADLIQDVFSALFEKLRDFRYDKEKSFRAWLRTVAVNKLRDRQRRKTPPMPLSDKVLEQALSSTDEFWEQEYRQYLVQRALEIMRTDFEEKTWKACWEVVVQDRPAAEVARELGITAGAVYVAKFRVLERLRSELDGLLD